MNTTQSTKSKTDALTQRMLVAAKKAGMHESLRSMRAIIVENNGKFFVDYEPTVLDSCRDIDASALDRAQAWIDKVTGQA